MGATVARAKQADFRAAHDRPALPSNIEAEQALLGILLYDAETVHKLPDGFGQRHFMEPYHGRVFAEIARSIRAGFHPDPVLIHETFRADPAHKELGGLRYLADMLDRSPPASAVDGYATVLMDLAARREMIRLAEAVMGMASTVFEDEDGRAMSARTLADDFQQALTAIQINHSREELVSLGDVVGGVMHYVDDRTAAAGHTSGLAPLDLQLGPMQPGDLILGAGRPSMGKSATALAISLGVAAPALADEMNEREYDHRAPAGVIEIHGEMGWGSATSGGQTPRRHLTDVGFWLYGEQFPTYKQIKDKHVSAAQRDMMEKAADYLRGVPIVGLKRTGLKLSTLRSLARRQIATWEREGVTPGLMLVDHVGLLRPEGRTSGRYEAQTEIAIGLKELADELGISILALVQLSREIERRDDKRPQLSDLRDSGAWEENADACFFVYRDAYYAQREKEPDDHELLKWSEWDKRRKSRDIDLLMGKLREGEAGGSAKVWGALGWNAIRGSAPQRGGMF